MKLTKIFLITVLVHESHVFQDLIGDDFNTVENQDEIFETKY